MEDNGRSGGRKPRQNRAIGALRNRINRIDGDILQLLAERRGVSQQMAQVKTPRQTPIRDQKREEELLVGLIREGRRHGLDAHFVTRVFHEVIDDSIRLQRELLQKLANDTDGEPELIRIAFQGIEGAYSHLAAKEFFAGYQDRLTFSGLERFDEVVAAVEHGQADYAMLPVENTTSGGINEVYDLLQHTRLAIVGEKKFRIHHCLVAAADVPIASLRRILSHPQAVAQCTRFLAGLAGCQVEYFTDTAMSVSRIKEEGDKTQAAIASSSWPARAPSNPASRS